MNRFALFAVLFAVFPIPPSAVAQSKFAAKDFADVLPLDTRRQQFAFYLSSAETQQRFLQAAALIKSGKVASADLGDLIFIAKNDGAFEARKIEPFLAAYDRQSGFDKFADSLKLKGAAREVSRRAYVRLPETEPRFAMGAAKQLADLPPDRWHEIDGDIRRFILQNPLLFGID